MHESFTLNSINFLCLTLSDIFHIIHSDNLNGLLFIFAMKLGMFFFCEENIGIICKTYG